MKILITGNMGYIGPSVVSQLRASYPEARLIGYDLGYFGSQLTQSGPLPECNVDIQYFADVRNPSARALKGVTDVVHLAAISNDPMGNRFEHVTAEINFEASVRLAEMAKQAGAANFIFASSCSIYGTASDAPRTEDSPINPLTAYARSKVATEEGLAQLADASFKTTSLRFATACGMSARLRLDLVLNDFVAAAVSAKKIKILSDGTPFRPLIHIRDMARAIQWAMGRDSVTGSNSLVLNVGSSDWNYQVGELATAVADILPGIDISINKDAQPDKRSYKVNFDLFKRLAPSHQPLYDLKTTIIELAEGLYEIGFSTRDFRNSNFIRLKVLESYLDLGILDDNLRWTFRQ